MSDPATVLDAASDDEARAHLQRCCGAVRWIEGMLARRPFGSAAAVYEASEAVWEGLSPADHAEAFAHHPRIGEDLGRLRERFATTAAWSAEEQSSARAASDDVLRELREANQAYERRFGFTFIVCATGKTAAAMLVLLKERLANPSDLELRIAAREQARITRLRLEKIGR